MPKDPVPDPAGLALQALGWIMTDRARADRFLDLTGLDPDALRQSVGERSTHRAVLDFLLAHEPDLVAAAADLRVDPAHFAGARQALEA